MTWHPIIIPRHSTATRGNLHARIGTKKSHSYCDLGRRAHGRQHKAQVAQGILASLLAGGNVTKTQVCNFLL